MISTRDETGTGLCPTPVDLVQDIITLSGSDGSASRFGSFSGTVYDTAWLSMIVKYEQDNVYPLFPKCFDQILKLQTDDKAWGAAGSQIDGILNSLAGLLALASRQQLNLAGTNLHLLQGRIEKAHSAIQKLLQDWDVSRSVHVGFEIVVPSLLRQLEVFDLCFDFPGYSTLMELNQQKLKRFDPSLVYSPVATTLLHSLEAFVGMVEFDKVGHHCKEESGIFGSPSSTAAYLINRTTWDDRAERYLKMVVAATGGTGLVPSAYPTCLFELSWALSTLLAPGVIDKELTDNESGKLSHLLERTLSLQNGVVGFAPGVLEDADDTARCLMSLQCLGKSPSPDRLIEVFQTNSHFRTYRLEGSPSFSANCNVLLALLGHADVAKYEEHIEKALTFLLKLDESGPVSDKWNLSSQYTRMLFMQALVFLLERCSSGHLGSLPTDIVSQRVPSCICRLLDQTLSTQESNGCWNDSLEITAYSIITLTYCLSLPWSDKLQVQLETSIARGRKWLRIEYDKPTKIDYLWIEKVSYRSSLLHAVYCSTAMCINVAKHRWSSAIADCFSVHKSSLKQMQYLISSLPLFHRAKISSLELVLVEANSITSRLRESRNVLFHRDDIPMTADKYLEFIPIIWVACNHKNNHQISAEVLWEMVLLSLLNFQVDEYMESVVARIPEDEIPSLKNLLKGEANRLARSSGALHGDSNQNDYKIGLENGHVNKAEDLLVFTNTSSIRSAVDKSFEVLKQFIHYILQHWSVRQASSSCQREVLTEVNNFLTAHITQNQDNIQLANSKHAKAEDNSQRAGNSHDYFDWVRTIASDDTSCPFSFLFFSCLISEPNKNCFEGSRAKYFSKSLCRHLATMCRQYNDYGSAKRDVEEENLNSLDFLKSSPPKSEESMTNGNTENSSEDDLMSAKEDLMAMAEFERSCMELAKQNLSHVVSAETMQKYQVFIDVTDMFGQVYVQRDIASRVKPHQ